MSLKFSKGIYKLKNPEKYVGNTAPKYRSSWEFSVMRMLDENPAFINWSSEGIKIPYRDPLTGKHTVYVPDFLVMYMNKQKKKIAELWEIKTKNQAIREHVGKNKYNQAQFVKNQVKWQVASEWCKQNKMIFRILTEDDIFHNGSRK